MVPGASHQPPACMHGCSCTALHDGKLDRHGPVNADLYFIEAGFISSTTISNNYIQAERGGIQIAFFSTGAQCSPQLPSLTGGCQACWPSMLLHRLSCLCRPADLLCWCTGFPTYPGNYSNHNTVVINSNTLTGSSFVPMLVSTWGVLLCMSCACSCLTHQSDIWASCTDHVSHKRPDSLQFFHQHLLLPIHLPGQLLPLHHARQPH